MHVACEPICQQPPSADPDKTTPSLQLSCLEPLKQCPGLLRNSAWLALRSLSFQSWRQGTFYLPLTHWLRFPPYDCFQQKTGHTGQRRGRERERKKSATLRNRITPGARLEMGTSERPGCWNAILSPLVAFPLTLNWECTYTHILNLLGISENWS